MRFEWQPDGSVTETIGSEADSVERRLLGEAAGRLDPGDTDVTELVASLNRRGVARDVGQPRWRVPHPGPVERAQLAEPAASHPQATDGPWRHPPGRHRNLQGEPLSDMSEARRLRAELESLGRMV